ncbi:hypothetical protein QPK32_18685 [Massilia sp. YIM B02763]|uniref:hypothetical protein n=1 Tax=Massilia sp. YIM B02763 TaxID=3050130 RepID=UPI0025B6D442|nr:hypothetical protein [Massilia sp. YIM B02763]MDN4055103.1 hypothetical protein [Massilia sp. YIM B02763]
MSEKRLKRIGVMSATLHGLLVAFFLSYPTVALMRFFKSFDPERHGYPDRTEWWMYLIVMPLLFALSGAVATALSCLAYNLSARLLGGVLYEDQT